MMLQKNKPCGPINSVRCREVKEAKATWKFFLFDGVRCWVQWFAAPTKPLKRGARSVLWAPSIYSSAPTYRWYLWFIKFGEHSLGRFSAISWLGGPFTNNWSINSHEIKLWICGWESWMKCSGCCIISASFLSCVIIRHDLNLSEL